MGGLLWGVTFLDLHYAAAIFIAFIVATFNNWFLSSKLIFRSSGRSTGEEFMLVYLVSGFGLLINFIVTSASIEALGMGLMIAKICGTGSAFVWNYAARHSSCSTAIPGSRCAAAENPVAGISQHNHPCKH